jgi:small-conductance mechanosensitive channel
MALLKACAEAHPGVLAAPGPVVAFDSFGDSALQFSLRVYLADISQALGVQSDLRIAMLKALREAGIEIPFNQVDVNLRDLDAVKRYLAQYLQERAGKAPDSAQPNAATAGNGKRVAGE